jgi:hypothetical protein
MPNKFERNYILDVEGLDGLIHTIKYPLTIEFSITRKTMATVNTGHFRIYNLNQDTRKQIYKDYFLLTKVLLMTLRAGYGDSLYTIFYGSVLEAKSYREEQSVNFITEIEGSDLGPAIFGGFVSETSTLSRQALIEHLVDSLPYAKRGAIANFEGEHPRGRVMVGNPWDILQTETEHNAFIDSGHVHCLRNNDAFEGEIPVINSDTGILGTPKRYNVYVVVEMLFEPALQLGQLVSLESRTQQEFNGRYKIYAISHQGVISGAVNGKCKTIVTLLTVNQGSLNLVSGNFKL